MDYCHFDVEGGDFVGEALCIIFWSIFVSLSCFGFGLGSGRGVVTSQYPSSAHCEEQYMAKPGVPRWAVIPVIATMCPFLFSRMLGNTAFTTFTGPKKFVSN